MGFKFDDDDDELSLDIGGDTAKTTVPAPLPPKQPKNDADSNNTEKVEARPAIPVKPKPVESTTDVLKTLPRPGQNVSKPSQKTEEDDLNSLLKAPISATPVAKQVADEPKPETTSTLIGYSPEKKEAKPITPLDEPFSVESDVILTREEFNGTLVKSKSNPFSGARKKVMQVRVVAGLVAALLMVAGVFSFLPSAGFSEDVGAQVIALDNGNQYESIRQASESYALKAMTDLLNVPDYESWNTQDGRMESYMDPSLVTALRDNFKLNTYKISGNSERPVGNYYQKVLNGPYVDNQEVINIANLQRLDLNNDGYSESFIYPLRIAAYVDYTTDIVELKMASPKPPPIDSKWVYYVVPIIHNFKTKTTYIYQLPSVTGAIPMDDYKAVDSASNDSPWNTVDSSLSATNIPFKSKFTDFFTAWAFQTSISSVTEIVTENPTLHNMLTLTDPASPLYPNYRIAQGLSDRYLLSEIRTIEVEGLPEETVVTNSTVRNALVTLTWKDKLSGFQIRSNSNVTPSTITQQYIVKFSGTSDWKFIDVKARFAE